MPTNVLQLVKRAWDQLRELQSLSKPDPSQSYFKALSFLASRYAVIPLIQENKHMRNIYEKTSDSYVENSLILSSVESNLSRICINITHICMKLHCLIRHFGLGMRPQLPAAGEQQRVWSQSLLGPDFSFLSEEWKRMNPAAWP